MIILWILLGIILFIIFLLCLPVTVKLSWFYPPKEREVVEHRSYLTDDVQEQIAAMELCEDDENILRQLVGELPPKELPPQKELLVSLRLFLLFKLQLFPINERPQKQRKPKEEPVKAETKPKEEAKKQEINWKETLPQLIDAVRKPLGMIVHDICLHELRLNIIKAEEDSASTALGSQKMATAIYTATAAAQNVINVKDVKINIVPDFCGSGDGDFTASFKVSIHPIVMLAAGARFGISFLKMLLKDKKGKDLNNSSTDGGKDERVKKTKSVK